jgi:hypothetical protein
VQCAQEQVAMTQDRSRPNAALPKGLQYRQCNVTDTFRPGRV